MMPKAGGQYVYLRESLGPLWGFLYGWTLFPGDPDGHHRRGCVAFGKFLGVFFPAISTTHWLWHIAHVPALRVGPMVLGNMEIGVNTANLTGIAGRDLPGHREHLWREAGRADPERLYFGQGAVAGRADSAGLYGGAQRDGVGGQLRRRLEPVLEECRLEFAAPGAGGRRRADGAGEPAGDSGGGAGGVAVFRRRMEQHHVHGGRGEEPQAQYSAVAGAGHGVCADGVFSGVVGATCWCCPARRPERSDGAGARHSVRRGGSRGDGGAGADFPLRRRVADGRGHSDFDLRLRQRT